MGSAYSSGGTRTAPAVVRRRLALLVTALAVPALLVIYGVVAAWPLFALPLAMAVPLGGPAALAAAALVAGCVVALATGVPGADGTAMALGLGAFVAAGIAVGMAHAVQAGAAARAREVDFSDRLTGLGNEEFFLDSLERECVRALRYGTPLSVVVLDMDRFTDFNRRFGAAMGDRMLAAVGEVIGTVTPRSDIPVRLEDGQFALLVPATEQEAAQRAERIRIGVAGIVLQASRNREADATISAGISAVRPDDDQAGTAVLDRAERALDAAKAGGRDRVEIFTPEHQRWAGSAA